MQYNSYLSLKNIKVLSKEDFVEFLLDNLKINNIIILNMIN